MVFRLTSVHAVGDWERTNPEGTVLLFSSLTEPSVNPEAVIVASAAVRVIPTTLGTVTGTGPLLIVRFTAKPDATLEFAAGF